MVNHDAGIGALVSAGTPRWLSEKCQRGSAARARAGAAARSAPIPVMTGNVFF